jgi:hypothetical protein
MYGEDAYENGLSKVRFREICANTDSKKKRIVIFSDPHCWLRTVAILTRVCAASDSDTAYATSQMTGSEQQHWSDKIMIQHNGTL